MTYRISPSITTSSGISILVSRKCLEAPPRLTDDWVSPEQERAERGAADSRDSGNTATAMVSEKSCVGFDMF